MLARTAPLWREMAGSRVFITGGTGFFGIWLLESIAAANDTLKVGVGATVLSRDPQRFLSRMPQLAKRKEFDWLCGHPATFRFPDGRHDYLLHLATATSAHLDQTDPIEMLKAKLSTISRVLDYARHAGIRRMLVTSSGAVYGRQPPELSHIPETYGGAPDPLNAASAYGTGKRLVEQVCTLTPEVDTVIARCFSFIGPHLPLDARFAAGNFLRDALGGRTVMVNGDGTPCRSYMHPADLVIWLITILLRGKKGRAYNVGSDQTVSIAELATSIATLGGVALHVAGPAQHTSIPPERYVPAIARARSELGLDVWIGLAESLRGTANWLKQQCSGIPRPQQDHDPSAPSGSTLT